MIIDNYNAKEKIIYDVRKKQYAIIIYKINNDYYIEYFYNVIEDRFKLFSRILFMYNLYNNIEVYIWSPKILRNNLFEVIKNNKFLFLDSNNYFFNTDFRLRQYFKNEVMKIKLLSNDYSLIYYNNYYYSENIDYIFIAAYSNSNIILDSNIINICDISLGTLEYIRYKL